MQATTTGRRGWFGEWPLPAALMILIVGWLFKSALTSSDVANFAVGIAFVAFFIGALLAAVWA
ncbi:MAG: hypothetical protein ACREPS_00950, partial [Rhodanobacteraceae bacterium]